MADATAPADAESVPMEPPITESTTTNTATATTIPAPSLASAMRTDATPALTNSAATSPSPAVHTLKRPRVTEPVTQFLNPSHVESPSTLAHAVGETDAVPPKQVRVDNSITPVTPRSPYADLPRKMPRKTPVSTPVSSLGTPALVSPSSQSPASAAPLLSTPPQVSPAAAKQVALHQRWATMLHGVLMKERQPHETEAVMELSLRIVAALPGDMELQKDGFQTILLSMKDAKNGELRRSVVEGELLVERLVRMDDRELANPEKRKHIKERMEDRAKNTNMSELAKAMRTSNSTLFKCVACGARDTSWFQRQTRSGDEPMTVIITCNKCNTQWRKY